MAIRDWHPGQLAVLWGALFFGLAVLYLAAHGSADAEVEVLAVIFAIAFLVAFLGGVRCCLVLTWKWSVGRKNPSA